MKLIKGKKAGSPKGMHHNYETMRHAGYSKKRSEGAAYGEVGMEKKARRHESEAMKKHHHHHHEKAMHHLEKLDHHHEKMEHHHKKAMHHLKKAKHK